MFSVYLIKSQKDESIYIGCTSDIKKRITEHNQGKSFHTKKLMQWKLIYMECFISKKDAFSREASLKLHAQGLRRLKERLRNTLMV